MKTLPRLAGQSQLCILLILCQPTSAPAQHAAPESTCGNPFKNHFGPYDYRTATQDVRTLVEGRHFTPGVETMTRPSTTTAENMAGDVGYTLNVFPNHHRALLTMVRLSEKHRSDPPPGSQRSVDCWFDRAIRFRPEDTVVRVLYAQFLHKKNRGAEALQQMKLATTLAADNPFSQYNIGLAYFDMREYERALEQAHKAMKMGFPRTELSERLRSVGKWSEPSSE